MSLKARVQAVIFDSDTPTGHRFDVVLVWLILISVLTVSLESVSAIRIAWGDWLYALEWVLTLIFTAEYLLRIWSAERGRSYALSFFGIVDLVAILPTYLSLFLAGTQGLIAIRILRLLRVFRMFRLVEFVGEGQVLLSALVASARKIGVFTAFIVVLVICLGSMMYVIEGDRSGFDSIPRAVYWAIVTLTTVGYGDITPVTPLGQLVASIVMLSGYAIIAVPTGIVTSELVKNRKGEPIARTCPGCGSEDHDSDARFCKLCGTDLSSERDAKE